jgi:hypothetical protein
MNDAIWIALIGAVAALGTPWMNALAKRWQGSNVKGKKTSKKQTTNQGTSSSIDGVIAKIVAFPFYAIAGWMFLIALPTFHDEGPLKGILFLVLAIIFVLVAHFSYEWISRPPQ